ncbi:hypothetical protein N9V84_02485 [Verrucomicrobiales bacterium]|jgi:hypothetical protein|nr:hypothetical protein [Verrucomicrobiales bacterium]
MTVTKRFLTIFSSLSLFGLPNLANAQEAPDTQALFESVNKNLDLGGQFYGYLNVKGDFSSLTTKAQEIYEQIAEMAEGQILPGMDITGFLQELGLQNLEALGLSSIKFDKGFRNRAFAAIKGDRQGILKLSGGPARPFEIGGFAPASSVLAMELDIELGGVKDLLEGIGGQLEKSMGMNPLADALQQPIPNTTLTIEQLLASLKGTLFAYATIDDTKTLQIPEPDFSAEIPGIDFVVAHKTGKPLYAEIKSLFEVNAPQGAIREEAIDGTTTLRLLMPDEATLGFYAPLFQITEDSEQLVMASRPEALASMVIGDRLSSNAEFVRAASLMPQEGNLFSYASEDIYRFIDVFSEVMEEVSSELGPLQGEAMALIYGEPQSIVSVLANTPDGILADGLAPMSYKLSLAYAAVMPAVLSGALMAPMIHQLR